MSERSAELATSLIILPSRDEPGLVREATTKFLVTPSVTRHARFRNMRRDTPAVVIIIVARYSARSSWTRERITREREQEEDREGEARFVTLRGKTGTGCSQWWF